MILTLTFTVIMQKNPKLMILLLVSAGLGDALGVDWASLVADVRRREQTTPSGGARDRWRPEKVLTRIGLSVQMAGKDLVQNILDKNADTLREEKKALEQKPENGEQDAIELNGTHENEEEKQELSPDVDSLHPVASIQASFKRLFIL